MPLSQVEPGVIWTFEQEQTFALTNVATVVRMTVIKLSSGGLWVYAPIAPTRYDLFLCLLLDCLLLDLKAAGQILSKFVSVPSVSVWACCVSWRPLLSTLCCRRMHTSTKFLCQRFNGSSPGHKSMSLLSKWPHTCSCPQQFIARNCPVSTGWCDIRGRSLACLEFCLGDHRQWSWPINFPLPLLGIFGAKTLHNDATDLPWADELEHVSLSESIGIAPYSEVEFDFPRTEAPISFWANKGNSEVSLADVA